VVGVRVPIGSRIFTSPYRPDRRWGPAPYPTGSWEALSPVMKRLGSGPDHSLLTSAGVNRTWVYASTPPHAFKEKCLISSAQGLLEHMRLQKTACRTDAVEPRYDRHS
jgi:hypothetical protein